MALPKPVLSILRRVLFGYGRHDAHIASQPPRKSRAGIQYSGQETASLYRPRIARLPKDSRFQFVLKTGDEKEYVQRHGTRYLTTRKLNKKERRAARRAEGRAA